MDKTDAMIDDVQDDGKTVLLDSKEEQQIEAEAEPVKADDPLELEKKEEKSEPKSYLSTEEPEVKADDKQERYIPVSAIQKERQRRHTVEQENAELKALLEKQGDLVGNDDLRALIEDPDELIDGKTVLKIVNQTRRQVADEVRQSIQQDRAEQETKARAKERAKQLDESEKLARKKFADFDSVVSTAVDNGFLTPDEIKAISRSKNPGAILYRKSKEALSILGVQPSVTGTQKEKETPKSPEADEDENIYSEVFK